ncbi:UDP-glucosyltransferase 2-like [Ostrinia nubilalis]|uniref:UDP-glucosyltransferase 2-like n=1 Tax=Ostrinia nubilalis TaxID=29057 RepID=UPI0030824C7D
MLPKKYTWLILLSILSFNEALRVLVWFPLFSKSHNILGRGVVNHLLKAGHEVVHVTSMPQKTPVPNLTEIDLSSIEEAFKQDKESNEHFKLKNLVGQKNFGDSIFFLYLSYEINKVSLEHEAVQTFLADPKQKFDAVILEWFFSDFIAGIAPLFNAPLIWMGSTEAHWQVLKLVDEIPNPAYSVDLFSVKRPPLTFWERMVELWTLAKRYVIINGVVVPFEKRLYNTIFPELAAKRGVTTPGYDDAVYNASLMYLYSHPSIGTPFRLPQNAKYVGGYHVDTEVKALPKDLQKIMDEAKDGVIYFSMGSNLKSVDMTENMRNSLLKMFSKLKQKVIWKFEEDLQNVPANIHLVKWAPQQSILAHPNLKMFITHGGQLSTTEAIHFGVPVVGIPVFGDQYVNTKSAVDKGFCISVTLAEDMADDIYAAVQEILRNPAYKTKAKELSAIFHDRPMKPGEELVYWLEYVVRTHGAKHLRSPAVNVPMYQKLFLDLLLVVGIGCYVLCKIKQKVFGKRKADKPVKSGKKTKTN